MSDALNLPTVERRPDGALHWNAAAAAQLATNPVTLALAAGALVQLPATDPRITRFIEDAQKDRVVLTSSGRTLLGMPVDGGTVCIIASRHQELERRAAAAELAASAAHEIANAMGGVISAAHIAQTRPDQLDAQAALAMVARLAGSARTVAKDLLGPTTAAPTTLIDLAEVTDDVVRLLSHRAIDRQLSLTRSGATQCHVRASRAQLFSITWNLIHNAVEIIPSGGSVSVDVRLEGDKVSLVVADDGLGMSVDELTRIFTPYFTQREGGTGLGLPLVKRTVEALGGEITVDSTPGRGARFHVVLPAVEERPESKGSTRPSSPLTGAKVLIVEDGRELREMMATTLLIHGAVVTEADGVEDTATLATRYDVAVIDLRLQDGRGDRLLAELRRRKLVDAAILTSGGPPPDEPAASPSRWLRKPFDPEALVDVVADLVPRSVA